MPRPGIFLLAAMLGGALVGPALAQRVPRRPHLSGGADTNDAAAYYQLGTERMERNPDAAAAAFYWSARLDPLSANVWYGQYAAQLDHSAGRLVKYVLRDPRENATPEVRAIDSLRLRAVALDVFVRRGFEQPLLKQYARAAIPRDQWIGSSQELTDPELVRQMEQYFQETDPYLRGLLAYSRDELRDALRYWGNALASQEHAWIRAERAALFFEMRQLDSARADAARAVEIGRPEIDTRRPWETPAGYGCVLGRVLEEMRNWAGARQAYQNAIASNPAYYPAWLRLGVLDLRTGDTTGAIDALRHELALLPDDFFAHVTLGALWNNRGRHDSALAHLTRATQIEPWASGGWQMMAHAQDEAGDTAQAALALERYLALAPQGDPARLAAQARLDRLQGRRP